MESELFPDILKVCIKTIWVNNCVRRSWYFVGEKRPRAFLPENASDERNG